MKLMENDRLTLKKIIAKKKCLKIDKRERDIDDIEKVRRFYSPANLRVSRVFIIVIMYQKSNRFCLAW